MSRPVATVCPSGAAQRAQRADAAETSLPQRGQIMGLPKKTLVPVHHSTAGTAVARLGTDDLIDRSWPSAAMIAESDVALYVLLRQRAPHRKTDGANPGIVFAPPVRALNQRSCSVCAGSRDSSGDPTRLPESRHQSGRIYCADRGS